MCPPQSISLPSDFTFWLFRPRNTEVCLSVSSTPYGTDCKVALGPKALKTGQSTHAHFFLLVVYYSILYHHKFSHLNKWYLYVTDVSVVGCGFIWNFCSGSQKLEKKGSAKKYFLLECRIFFQDCLSYWPTVVPSCCKSKGLSI